MAAKDRPTSTAIPVPASGTSRRMTSMQKTNKSCLVPLLSPEKARRPSHRRSVGTKADLPPSSYHLPRSLLPRSESLLTDFENDRHFERVFDSPKFACNKFPGLPKSQTTPALLSPNKDIASHSLLKPVGPPLPRSNTYNDLSTVRAYSNSPERVQPSTAKICFWGANISEKPDVLIARTKSPYAQAPNAKLPLRYVPQISITSLSPYGTDGSVSSVIEIPSSSETDPRFVYAYELSSYWTGRYVALLDRLRTRKFIAPPSSEDALARGNAVRKTNPKPKESAEFSCIEVNIEKEAMKILRSFCQTKAATESFDHFEYMIRRQHIESIRRSEAIRSRDSADVYSIESKIADSQSVALLDNPKTDRWMLGATLPQRIFRKASSTVQQQPNFEKSITVGNLCNPQFYISSNSPFEGSRETHGSIQHSASAVNLPGTIDCSSKTRTLPKSNDRPPRLPLRISSEDRLNIAASRNFSHRNVKQTVTLVESEPSLKPVSTKSSEEISFSGADVDATPMDTSRRFRKSDSFKQLVDYSIREVKKMGKRKVASETTDNGHEV